MAVTIREGKPNHGQEILIERPDGTRRAVMVHPHPLHDTRGALNGAVNMLVDITARRVPSGRSIRISCP